MLELILTSLIMIIVMFIFLFITLKGIIKRIDQNASTYFVEKMQDYNYLIEEKEEKIKELNKRLEELKEQNNKITIQNSIKQEEKEKIEVKIPTYREDNFFYNYKELKNKFDIDSKEIIKQFLEKNSKEKNKKEYEVLTKIKQYFDKETIYECLTLTNTEQKELIKELTNSEERRYLKLSKLDKNNDFNILKLIKYIENRLEEINPTITVYVGNKRENYDYMSDNIITKFYKNMSEGIIIKYRDKMYDFSI